jgi:hypothetical protein
MERRKYNVELTIEKDQGRYIITTEDVSLLIGPNIALDKLGYHELFLESYRLLYYKELDNERKNRI